MPLSAAQADRTRQALIECGVPPSEVEEVIESIRSELSKGDDTDATKTKLQKISTHAARAMVGASSHPDKIANQEKEIYETILYCIKGEAAAAGVEGITVAEKVGGELGKWAKGIGDLLKTPAQPGVEGITVAEKVGGELGKWAKGIGDLLKTPARQRAPTARPHPQQPPGDKREQQQKRSR